jgi:3-oxoadipate enol-lactonase
MKLIQSQDAELRCDHTPRPGAPALLLLNPLGTSLEIWDDQFEPLSERYELIRYDKRGHGKSTLGSRSELTVEDLARDAIAILDACGIARAHLCGLSVGGMTAMRVATLWPDRVLRIAICNSSAHMPPRENWQSRIETVRKQGMSALVETVIDRWFTQAFRQAQPARVQRVRDMLLATDPNGYAAVCAAIRDMDQRASIRDITATTLVIGGTHDPAATPEHVEQLARSIQGAKLVMLDAAHVSNIESTAEFNDTLLEFLAA